MPNFAVHNRLYVGIVALCSGSDTERWVSGGGVEATKGVYAMHAQSKITHNLQNNDIEWFQVMGRWWCSFLEG